MNEHQDLQNLEIIDIGDIEYRKPETLMAFHGFYYHRNDIPTPEWKGIPIVKIPNDLWTYQELIYSCEIDTLIETGTAWGGSAWYFVNLFDSFDRGHVITIDLPTWKDTAIFMVSREDLLTQQTILKDLKAFPDDFVMPDFWHPEHPRITYFSGDSIEKKMIAGVKEYSTGNVMVVLDSDHSKSHVLAELNAYSNLVTPGSYLVVEDSNINGHPVYPEFGPGPYEAVLEWLPDNPDFEIDTTPIEKYMFSYNTWLRRK